MQSDSKSKYGGYDQSSPIGAKVGLKQTDMYICVLSDNYCSNFSHHLPLKDGFDAVGTFFQQEQ